MLPKKFEDIRDILRLMKDLEQTVAELYRSCGESWPEDKEFWAKMEGAELKHARNIDEMIRIVSEKSESYQIGHRFKPPAVRTFISAVRSNIQRLSNREIGKDKILFIARDIEEALLESKYGEILPSGDSRLHSLMNEIILETKVHKDLLNEKMEKSGPR